jgi:hypothetical protein
LVRKTVRASVRAKKKPKPTASISRSTTVSELLSYEEAYAAFDSAARHYYGMSGEEFSKRWDAGEITLGGYSSGIDVAMLRPTKPEQTTEPIMNERKRTSQEIHSDIMRALNHQKEERVLIEEPVFVWEGKLGSLVKYEGDDLFGPSVVVDLNVDADWCVLLSPYCARKESRYSDLEPSEKVPTKRQIDFLNQYRTVADLVAPLVDEEFNISWDDYIEPAEAPHDESQYPEVHQVTSKYVDPVKDFTDHLWED